MDIFYKCNWILFLGKYNVPFKPTVKNIAKYLTTIMGPAQLADEHIELVKVVVETGNLCESYTVDWLNEERVAKGWFPI